MKNKMIFLVLLMLFLLQSGCLTTYCLFNDDMTGEDCMRIFDLESDFFLSDDDED